MAPYIYMIVIVNDFVCYDYGVWRMIAIPGNADKRMSGSVCEARDRRKNKTIVQTRGMRSSLSLALIQWPDILNPDCSCWDKYFTHHILSQMPELKSCAGTHGIGGWCIGMQELGGVSACAPGGGRQPGQPGQTRSRQTCWSQAQAGGLRGDQPCSRVGILSRNCLESIDLFNFVYIHPLLIFCNYAFTKLRIHYSWIPSNLLWQIRANNSTLNDN